MEVRKQRDAVLQGKRAFQMNSQELISKIEAASEAAANDDISGDRKHELLEVLNELICEAAEWCDVDAADEDEFREFAMGADGFDVAKVIRKLKVGE